MIRKWCKDTKYFTAHEAVQYGFADSVLSLQREIMAPKRGSGRKKRTKK
jgi:ATP-dependent protease ClpP protease subunit